MTNGYSKIPVNGPFRLATALNVLFRYERPRLNPREPARASFSLEVPDGAVEVTVRQQRPGDTLEFLVLGDRASQETIEYVNKTLIRMFALDVDASDFFERVRDDSHLKLASSLYPDLRPVRMPTPFEAAIKLIIGHRISPETAVALIRNLVEVCGIIPSGRPNARPAFPGRATILAMPDKLLEITGIVNEKIQKIRELASSQFGEEADMESIFAESDPMIARKRLEDLPGIGRRTAEHILLRAYPFNDMLNDDPILQRAVQRFYHLAQMPDEKTMKRFAQPFMPWRSWWMFLLYTVNETSVIV